MVLLLSVSAHSYDTVVDWNAIEQEAVTVDVEKNKKEVVEEEPSQKEIPELEKEEKPEHSLEIDESALPKESAEEESIEVRAFQLKNYTNVRYSKRLSKLSLYRKIPGKERYRRVKELMRISDLVEPTLLERYWTPKGILLSAFYYDYIKKKPNIAENFYKRFSEGSKESFLVKRIYLADYYLRTRRPGKILKVLPRRSCMEHFQYMIPCLYYRGIATYILTGNNKNDDLCQAANNGIDIARKICYGY